MTFYNFICTFDKIMQTVQYVILAIYHPSCILDKTRVTLQK